MSTRTDALRPEYATVLATGGAGARSTERLAANFAGLPREAALMVKTPGLGRPGKQVDPGFEPTAQLAPFTRRPNIGSLSPEALADWQGAAASPAVTPASNQPEDRRFRARATSRANARTKTASISTMSPSHPHWPLSMKATAPTSTRTVPRTRA